MRRTIVYVALAALISPGADAAPWLRATAAPPNAHAHARPVGTCSAPASPSSLLDTEWTLVRLGTEPIVPSRDQSAPSLRFSGDGTIAGFGGCNRLTSRYRIDGDDILLGPTAATRLACPGTMETEAAFLLALDATNAWRLHDGQLELLDNEGRLLARFKAQNKGGSNMRQ
ncbi:MAG: META domain-containing protein [Betaproteobacteria bacterium]